jgi:halocyanin-like protein
MQDGSRRRFLRWAGGTAAVGLAGCTGGGGDGGDGGGGPVDGAEYPSVDRWLTETSVGAADDTYEGTLTDLTGRETVTIAVGSEGNDGHFAFGPSAAVVSAGTTVRWEWTGMGNPHNVEAEPEDQIGESDYEFSSGEAEGGSGVKYTLTLDETGIALYHCEPHLSLGMKGGIAVV